MRTTSLSVATESGIAPRSADPVVLPQPDSRAANRVLAIVLLTYLMIILDASIVITGLAEIQTDLNFSGPQLSWVQNIYTLTFGSLLLLGARSGDLLGRRRMLITGLVLFGAASLLIGVATSPLTMLLGRTLQGMGAAILAPATLTLLALYFPEGKERVKALAWYAATAGAGSSLGLVLGGWLAGWFSWRVGFWINVPLALLLMVLAARWIDETRPQPGSFDIRGALISITGLGALVFAMVHASESGWSHPASLTALIIAALAIPLFIRTESRHPHPLLPLHLFHNRQRNGALLARMLFLGSMVSFLFFSSRFMQQVMGFSPVQAGFAFLPFTLLTFIASTRVPTLTRRFGNQTVAVLALITLGIGFLGLGWILPANSHNWWLGMALPMAIIGLGNGTALGPLTISAVANTRREDAGAASGLVNVAHQIGGTLGLSLAVLVAASVSGVLENQLIWGLRTAAVLALLSIVAMLYSRHSNTTTANQDI